MPELAYLLAALATVFVITLALRAVPFAVLAPLRRSKAVAALAEWMPVGIVAILAATLFAANAGSGGGHLVEALVALTVTVVVHLLGGRRTLLSVIAGTIVFVVLVNVV